SECDALARLLAGSGLEARRREDGVVLIVRAAAGAPPPPVARPAHVVDLSSVVVTARKRDERRVDVPMAVTALGTARADGFAFGRDGVAGALGTAPAASSVDLGGGFTQVQIRGVSSSLGGNDNGYYLDEIPFTGVSVPWYPDARAFDLDRVE